MKQPICWTERGENGLTREVRVEVAAGSIRWRFKRADEMTWDCDSEPDADDWDKLEEILERRAARGRSVNMQETVRKWRRLAGHREASEQLPDSAGDEGPE